MSESKDITSKFSREFVKLSYRNKNKPTALRPGALVLQIDDALQELEGLADLVQKAARGL